MKPRHALRESGRDRDRARKKEEVKARILPIEGEAVMCAEGIVIGLLAQHSNLGMSQRHDMPLR